MRAGYGWYWSYDGRKLRNGSGLLGDWAREGGCWRCRVRTWTRASAAFPLVWFGDVRRGGFE